MSESEFSAASRGPEQPSPLRSAMRQARIEAAERSAVIVDLHDAEFARLELLNEALAPVFAEVPPTIDLFDRGLVPGDPPRLWIDMVAHVAMGRDKRLYRFLQDTRNGRRVLAESPQIEPIVAAITRYVARRMVEREQALASEQPPAARESREARVFKQPANRRRWLGLGLFALGMLAGAVVLLAAAWLLEPLIY